MESSITSEDIQQIFQKSLVDGIIQGITIMLPYICIIIAICIIYRIAKRIYKREPNIFKKIKFLIQNKGDKGAYGEWLIEYMLNNSNLNGYSKLLRNIYITYKERTTEIDIIIVHEKGIFVIESKNYSGWIFGNLEQINWTQCLQNKEKNHFYNPIKQNRTHINALSKFLEIEKNNMKSFIVFSERCELKKVPSNTAEFVILKRGRLLKKIKQELKGKENIFSKQEVDEIYNNLFEFTNASDEVKQKHIDEIKEIHKK